MLNGIVKEIYTTPITDDFDTVILDSIFHFYKNAIEKETKHVVRIAQVLKVGGIIYNFMLKGDAMKNTPLSH